MEIPVDRGEYHEAPWKILGGGVKLEKKTFCGGSGYFPEPLIECFIV